MMKVILKLKNQMASTQRMFKKLVIVDDDDQPYTRKRKNTQKTSTVPSQRAKEQKLSEANAISCDTCNAKFATKDNLASHNNNKDK